jgi:hypothetical protein
MLCINLPLTMKICSNFPKVQISLASKGFRQAKDSVIPMNAREYWMKKRIR